MMSMYLPNKQNIIIYLFIFAFIGALFLLISRFIWICNNDLKSEFGNYINVTYVILLALIIFVAEYLRDRDETASARLLLKKTFLFPLLYISLLFIIFQTILTTLKLNTQFNIFFILLTYAIFIIAFARLIKILSKKYSFFTERNKALRDRVTVCLDPYINNRLGNNILLGLLGEQEIMLKYSPLFLEQTQFDIFRSKKKGAIIDVNLKLLKRVSKVIETEANKNNYGFHREAINRRVYNDGSKRFLLKVYGSEIKKGEPLAAIRTGYIVDKKALRKIGHMVQKAILIDSVSLEDSMDEIRFEFKHQKDRFVEAINEGFSGETENITRTYISGLIEPILDLIKEYELNCSLDEARSLRASFMRLTRIRDIAADLEWISKDLREVLSHGLSSNNRDIISDIGYIPTMVGRRAFDISDSFFFLQFLDLHPLLYTVSDKQLNSEVKAFMIDRAWRYIKEFADHYVERELNEIETVAKRLEALKDYAISIFAVFQTLLREASRKGDWESYFLFAIKAAQLFRRFNPSADEMNVRHIDRLLNSGRLHVNERYRYSSIREKQQHRENIEREIKRRRNEMLFGVAAFVFEEHAKDEN